MKVTNEGENEKEIIIREKSKIQCGKRLKKQRLKERGITLIALVVTIVILLILAGVTLNLVLSGNGLFSRAQNAADRYKSAQENEVGMLAELEKQFSNLTSNQLPTPPKEEPPKTVKEAKEREYEFENTITVTDEKGNAVVVPGKFHISSESGETVQEGIVIEDDEGNQFVWIPVSNIDGDNNETTSGEEQKEEDLIVLSDETKVEITLGRYTFDTTNGTPDLKQAGNNYANTVPINTYYQEVETSKHTNGGEGAKDDEAKYVESDLVNSYAWDTAIVYLLFVMLYFSNHPQFLLEDGYYNKFKLFYENQT